MDYIESFFRKRSSDHSQICFGCLSRRFGHLKRQLYSFDRGLYIDFKNIQKVIELLIKFGLFDLINLKFSIY